MTAQASGRQGWLAPACQLRNRNLFWATNRLTHGLSSAIPDIPSAVFNTILGLRPRTVLKTAKRLRVYPVSLQSPGVNLYIHNTQYTKKQSCHMWMRIVKSLCIVIRTNLHKMTLSYKKSGRILPVEASWIPHSEKVQHITQNSSLVYCV